MSRQAKPAGRGRKGDDINERQTGAGWTTAATQRLFELTTVDEQFGQVLQMFSLTESDYQFDARHTTQIDFDMGVFLWCADQHLDVGETTVFCKLLHRMFEYAISHIDGDVYELRMELYAELRSGLQDPAAKFTEAHVAAMIRFVNLAFLRPLRLYLRPYMAKQEVVHLPTYPPVFGLQDVDGLAAFAEQAPGHDADDEFGYFDIGHERADHLATLKAACDKYADAMIATIDRRYARLESEFERILPAVSAV